eukprot:SAG11_NODE_1113_length_5809_cov_37.515672_5_plen_124_part_00
MGAEVIRQADGARQDRRSACVCACHSQSHDDGPCTDQAARWERKESGEWKAAEAEFKVVEVLVGAAAKKCLKYVRIDEMLGDYFEECAASAHVFLVHAQPEPAAALAAAGTYSTAPTTRLRSS